VRTLAATGLVLVLAAHAPAAPRDAAIERAARWLAGFPAEQLRFDAAVMLHGIRAHVDSSELRTAWHHARTVADRDRDHPLRRLWVPDLVTPATVTRGWTVPRRGAPRASTERLVIETVHCDRNGLRRAAVRYACTAMRDHGGYYTTHALWALVMARERACAPSEKLRRCIAHLVREVRAAQPAVLRPIRTLDVDLFAERTLTSCLADPARPRPRDVDALLDAQRHDGSWGVVNPEEQPYFRYHATGTATWALAACP
jgi:hypothetical protein